jgi:hypothetical protein
MDKILQQIEDEFAPQIQKAQDVFNSAQTELNNIVAVSEEKKKAVKEYYTAIADKERAELIIANSDVSKFVN